MNSLVTAIHKLKPTAEFTFKEADYSTIEWISLEGEAPTQQEIDAAIAEIEADEAAAKVAVEAQKQSILDRLGITADEAALLLK